MTDINLELLGLKREDLQDRVVDGIVDRMLSRYRHEDEDGDRLVESDMRKDFESRIKAAVDLKLTAIFEKHILPNVHTYVNDLVLTETNKWGEAKGNPVTFVEYLVQRAEAYIQEDVDYAGKSRAQAGSYSWNRSTTRIAFMIHEHIQYNIEVAIKKILADANSTVVGGLQKAFCAKLEELKAQIKVTVAP